MTQKRKVVISGASGFLGRHLSDFFRKRGFDVAGLVRNTGGYPFGEPGIQLFRCNLPDDVERRAFEGAEIVIHCAYTTKVISAEETERVNVGGTKKILELSRGSGAKKFVFISSTGATPEAESLYGKSKFKCEKLMNPEKDLVVRPGLIIGSGTAGSFNRMKGSVAGLGIVPLFGGGRQVLQTVHVEDLCQAIGRSIEKNLSGTLVIAEDNGMTIRQFFQEMARLMGKKCLFVPLPLPLTLWGLKIIEALRIPFPLSSENLLGLKHMVYMPSEKDLQKIGFKVRSAAESLRASI